nr:hypothetical protein BaRGS_028428 [Batillaria attramentaria]
MAYLHQSPVHHHGNLRSSNCVVDRRFNLKVTDFGLPSFKRPQVVGGTDDDQHGKLENILDRVIKRQSPPFRPKVREGEAPQAVLTLMEQCWKDDPEMRPSFETVLKAIKAVTSGKDANLVEALITRLEEYASNLEDVVEERTKELIDEKKKSEMLLYQILPRSVAEQLKRGQQVVPEAYDSVTIYFSDIVGFTAMSAASTPMQVVEVLNDLYSEFDSIIDAHDVYKVETIGDAYMVVSGLPEKNGDQHAVEICRMALRLLHRVQTFTPKHRHNDRLQLRIGIHSGPCCAGVVGLKMPRYCLFGDTVNTASRLESTGEVKS